MKSRRLLKAASAIREVVSTAILLELRDPRVRNVTVTGVEVAPDMRLAKVYVSVMGDERQQTLTMHGLKNSAGFLQQQIGEKIDTRYIPRLEFVLDKGVKNSLDVARILREVLPADPDGPAAENAISSPHDASDHDASDHDAEEDLDGTELDGEDLEDDDSSGDGRAAGRAEDSRET
ncbi:MAG: 30S ribosome-binding factor RbfA [Pirellulales bacterium]